MEGVVAEPFDSWRGIVVLDTTIYPELQAEGWARDFVRIIQAARKQADLKVTDRINIAAFVAPELVHALTEHRPYIMGETLALGFDIVSQDVPGDVTNVVEDQIDQYPLRVQIKRVGA